MTEGGFEDLIVSFHLTFSETTEDARETLCCITHHDGALIHLPVCQLSNKSSLKNIIMTKFPV